MVNVPRVPGVPQLPSYSAVNPLLVTADVISVVRSFLPTQWGIYAENGEPVILPATQLLNQITAALQGIGQVASLLGANILPTIASTLEFDFSGDAPISDYPQQGGAFTSYNKVTLPYDVRLSLACSGNQSQRQAFIITLIELKNSVAVVDVVTPEYTFTNVNCVHVDFRRSASRGVSMIIADVAFKQVRTVRSTAVFVNTQQPANAGVQAIGNVQPQEPSGVVTQRLIATGGIGHA